MPVVQTMFGIDRIGRRPAALAAADRVPAFAYARIAAAAAAATIGSPPSSRRLLLGPLYGPVLLVAVDVVGNLVVDRHVVHLRDRQADAIQPRAGRA